jgi:hypothetical protein
VQVKGALLAAVKAALTPAELLLALHAIDPAKTPGLTLKKVSPTGLRV